MESRLLFRCRYCQVEFVEESMKKLPAVSEFHFAKGEFSEAPLGTPDRTGWMRHLTTWHKCGTHFVGVADVVCLKTKGA